MSRGTRQLAVWPMAVLGVIAVPCSVALAEIVVLEAGIEDEFAPPPEPATPHPVFLEWIEQCTTSGIPLMFDEIPFDTGPPDSYLGHTFTDLPCPLIGGTLTLRVAAGPSALTFNDHVWMMNEFDPGNCQIDHYWSARFENLPESGGRWEPGDRATFVLDLSALPWPDGPLDLLDEIACDRLVVAVDDDSGTDFIRIELAVDTGTPVHEVSWAQLRARYR